MHTVAEQVIGFPRESMPGDRRTLLTPAVADSLREAGFGILAEPGIGAGVFCGDSSLTKHGVQFAEPARVWAAPLVLRYKSANPEDLRRLQPGQSIGALFHAEGDPALLSALADCGATVYSYEFVRECGRFPLAAPGGEIAGVQAILSGAQALQSLHGGRGILLARVTGGQQAQVVVIGCGNVGSAAARTAAALGADVTVLVHSKKSAGEYRKRAPNGVRVEINTLKTRRDLLARVDLVVGAILVSTFDTPPMITEADLCEMKTGAVIVDVTCGYGPGYLPTAGAVQQPGEAPRLRNNVLHVKLDILPSLVPVTATEAYASNAAPYLVRLARTALVGISDPAIESARIACKGQLVHPVCRRHATFYGIPE